MKVQFAYGTTGLALDLPDERTTVLRPRRVAPAPDARAEIMTALVAPVSGPALRDRVKPGQTVAISVCDGTRPQPRELVVPAILEALEGRAQMRDVVVIVATGTHRSNSPEELRAMLGDEVMSSVSVLNHDARKEDELSWVGTLGRDVPVWLNKEWLRSDVRITTGFVEPHFFAGFSGGPKMVAPGLAGLETTLVLHDASRIGHPDARWGVTKGNPVHDDVSAIAQATGTTFSLDVVLDRGHRVVKAFGGDMLPMHAAACEMVREISMQPVGAAFDVVVTSNAGFPLDQNLYQAVKGMSAAAQVVKRQGTIICVAECRDGFPQHGLFRQELAAAGSAQELLEAISKRDKAVPDQWQAQVLASIMLRSKVIVSTGFLSDDEISQVHLEQTHDVAATIDEVAPGASVCALPQGPETVPYLA